MQRGDIHSRQIGGAQKSSAVMPWLHFESWEACDLYVINMGFVEGENWNVSALLLFWSGDPLHTHLREFKGHRSWSYIVILHSPTHSHKSTSSHWSMTLRTCIGNSLLMLNTHVFSDGRKKYPLTSLVNCKRYIFLPGKICSHDVFILICEMSLNSNRLCP